MPTIATALDEPAFVAALANLGDDLTFHKPHPVTHRQIREAGKVWVDWWPTTGRVVMHNPSRTTKGIKDYSTLLEWLKSV